MSQSPGFVHPMFQNFVCKLHRSLYGLKQLPREWYSRMSSSLMELGFVGSKADTSLFVKQVGSNMVFLLIYGADILLTGCSPTFNNQVVKDLQHNFVVTDLSPLHYFLGIEAC